jgi:hypothetical protein
MIAKKPARILLFVEEIATFLHLPESPLPKLDCVLW